MSRAFNRQRARARRAGIVDRGVVATGPEKSARIDLGLALLHRVALPGVCYSLTEIAAWAGCSDSAIYLIEQSALKKLRKRWRFMGDPRLRDMMIGLFEERSAASRRLAA